MSCFLVTCLAGLTLGGGAEVGVARPQSSPAPAVQGAQLPARSWQRTPSTIALIQDDHIVWRYNFSPSLNTPYFDPVSTVDGRQLSWDRPPDHAWHHGLWFCWKFINGHNYWEHTGLTPRPEGRTEWSDVEVVANDHHSARITMTLTYHPQDDATVVLVEQRRIEISTPDAEGTYCIDWTSQFTAQADDVILDRVPPLEQPWGGYAGLSVRFAKELIDRQAVNMEGPVEFGEGGRHRGHSQAMDYNGLIHDSAVGLAFLDHPENPRHPTPWYAIGSPEMSYLNAALLSDDPMELKSGDQMTLRYRLIVHSGRWSAKHLKAEYARFILNETSDPGE